MYKPAFWKIGPCSLDSMITRGNCYIMMSFCWKKNQQFLSKSGLGLPCTCTLESQTVNIVSSYHPNLDIMCLFHPVSRNFWATTLLIIQVLGFVALKHRITMLWMIGIFLKTTCCFCQPSSFWYIYSIFLNPLRGVLQPLKAFSREF